MAAVPPVIPVVPAAFSRSPWENDAVIDFSTTEGRKLFTTGTAPILPKYDGDQQELMIFLSHLSNKGEVLGWTDTIFKINTGTAAVPVEKNLTQEYGLITLDQCKAKAAVFLAEVAGNRATQSSNMLRLCLAGSVTNELLTKILMREDQYTITAQGRQIQDGSSMLKVLISIVCIETRATVAIIRMSLQTLPDKMIEMGSNVTEFNIFVNKQIRSLNTRGQNTEDLLISLFRAYLAVQDSAFVKYITDVESKYEDGTIVELTPAALMITAEDKYKIMLQKKTWQAPTKEEEKLVVLQAAYDALEKKTSNLKKAPPARTPRSDRSQRNPRTKEKEDWAWKNIAPKDGEKTTCNVNGKDWVYCPNHGELKWVLKKNHKDGCTLAPGYKAKKGSDPKALKYAKALAHIKEDDDDSEDGSEGEDEDENL